jgi:hypothetical protein
VLTNGFSLPLATINDLNFSISQAKGLWGPNAANTSAFTDNGFFDETGGINYGGGGGTVQPDTAFPFLPGSDGSMTMSCSRPSRMSNSRRPDSTPWECRVTTGSK